MAVRPLIEAYIGGKKPILSTPGIRTVKSAATKTGTAIETTHIQTLYFFELFETSFDITSIIS